MSSTRAAVALAVAVVLSALAAACAPRGGHVAVPGAAPSGSAPGGRAAPAGKGVALSATGGATAAAALEPEPPPDPTPATPEWTALHEGVDRTATIEDCLGCHGEVMARKGHAHPVGLDYAAVAERPKSGYRPLADARARGVYLPAGQVVCLTCHSPSSTWAQFLAVPAALARVRVELADPSTFEPVEGPDGQPVEPPAPPAGSAVSPKPLCESCHEY